MTLQQIQLAVEAASKNSITKAAETFNMAQSNASQSLRKLEKELGFPIFKKSGNRIVPTEEGYRFLNHAEAISKEARGILSIETGDKTARLRVGVANYAPPIDSFVKFLGENKDIGKGDFACIHVSAEEGVTRLRERSLDIVIAFVLKSSLTSLEMACKDYHLKLDKLHQITACVRVRKEHPLVLDGTLDGTFKGFKNLAKYPYAEYSNLRKMMDTFNMISPNPFGSTYRILIEERDTRLRTVAATDAYSIGCHMMEKRLEKYGVVEIPIKGESFTLVSIIRKGDENINDIKRYKEILEEETLKLLADQNY